MASTASLRNLLPEYELAGVQEETGTELVYQHRRCALHQTACLQTAA